MNRECLQTDPEEIKLSAHQDVWGQIAWPCSNERLGCVLCRWSGVSTRPQSAPSICRQGKRANDGYAYEKNESSIYMMLERKIFHGAT